MRSSRFAASVWLAFLIVLAGCAGAPSVRHPAALDLSRYSLEGRFSLRQGESNFSGRISWAHERDTDRILIADPFGGGIAELERLPGRTRLTLADGRSAEDADPAALIQRLTGLPLPVGAIGGWLTGRFAGEAGAEADRFGRAVGLDRDGWRVRFDYADDAADALPSRVFARRADELELRLSIERWDTLP